MAASGMVNWQFSGIFKGYKTQLANWNEIKPFVRKPYIAIRLRSTFHAKLNTPQ